MGRHWPALDGLRGVGMVAMLLYHGGTSFVPGAFLLLSQFFTLSGFLITGIIIDALVNDRFYLKEFWYRRFRRLMPAALAVLAGVVVFGSLVSTRQQAEELPGEIAAAALYVVNWLFILREVSYVDLFDAPSPVQHFWSLAVEEQAYLLMPLVLLGIWRVSRSLRAMAVAFLIGTLASLSWMIHLYRGGAGVDRVYYGTDTRMSEILVGGLLAIVLYRARNVDTRRLRWAGWTGTIAYLLVWGGVLSIGLADSTAWNGAIALFSVLSALSILGIVSGRGALPRLLAIRPLPEIGRVTYGLYLFHWPVFLWLDQDRTGLDGFPLLAVRIAVTAALATASYHLLEVPIRTGRLRPKVPAVRVTVGPAVAVAIIASAVVTIDPLHRPDPFVTLRGSADIMPVAAPSDGVLDVLVITDESGASVADRMEVLAEERSDTNLVRSAPFRCDELIERSGGLMCQNWEDEWSDLVDQHDLDIVVLYLTTWPTDAVTGQAGLSDAELRDSMEEVLGNGLDVLTGTGARVVWSPAGGDHSIHHFTNLTGVVVQTLERDRDDIRRLVYRMPTSGSAQSPANLDESARRLLIDAFLYQRSDLGDVTRVLVVGDSQARTLGYGLEIWGAERGDVLVWNIATEGCGLIREGRFGDPPTAIPPNCAAALDAIPDRVADFDPDIAVVLATGRDLEPVTHERWNGSKLPGDPEFDDFATEQYGRIADVLSERGARIVWMTAPCVPVVFESKGDDLHPNERAQRLNAEVLRPLAAARSDMSLFPLDEILCPDGRFTRNLGGVDNIRFDGIHFSAEGSIWFARTYGDQILEAGR